MIKVTVTRKELREKDACGDGLRDFTERYGKKVKLKWDAETQIGLLKDRGMSEWVSWAQEHHVIPAFMLEDELISGGRIFATDIVYARLMHAEFDNVLFDYGVNFSDSDLSYALFKNCDIERTSIFNCDVSGLRFDDCEIGRLSLHSPPRFPLLRRCSGGEVRVTFNYPMPDEIIEEIFKQGFHYCDLSVSVYAARYMGATLRSCRTWLVKKDDTFEKVSE